MKYKVHIYGDDHYIVTNNGIVIANCGRRDRYAHLIVELLNDLPQFKCQGCDKLFESEDDFIPVEEIKDLFERVLPGETMPYGECPECRSVIHKREI